ncbi:hypothetical protein PENSPDRAFT_695396 [Peniophora sp. CONT]|nr:hypothetical protein PENSPDRAFT_695396 [Peniophora sp. CONT]
MPEWHSADVKEGGPLRCCEGEDWSAAMKGGQNGFRMEKEDVAAVVDDLAYALGKITLHRAD